MDKYITFNYNEQDLKKLCINKTCKLKTSLQNKHLSKIHMEILIYP